jgi:transposase
MTDKADFDEDDHSVSLLAGPSAPPLDPVGLRARALYAEGRRMRLIMQETGLSSSAVYLWLRGGPGGQLPALAQRRGAPPPMPADARMTVVRRLWRAADGQTRRIEASLAALSADDETSVARREREVRQMAVLAKTLRELVALDRALASETEDDDRAPADSDQLRDALADRLERLARQTAVARSAGDRGSEP